MPKVLSDATAMRLLHLLNKSGGPAPPTARAAGRYARWAFVRCDSATAVGGDDILDQCYPATILAPAADYAAPSEELAGVLLTVLTIGGESAVPIEGAVYGCVLTGEVVSDRTTSNSRGNGRSRAFSVLIAGAPATTYDTENGDPASTTTATSAPDADPTSTPILTTRLVQDSDGSGTPSVTLQFQPEGTGGPAAAMTATVDGFGDVTFALTSNYLELTADAYTVTADTYTVNATDVDFTGVTNFDLTGVNVTGLSSASPWTKYTKTFSDFSTAAAINDIELFSLPAKTVIEALVIKSTTAFTGGTISSYGVSVGIAGTLDKYSKQDGAGSTWEVGNVVSNTNFAVTGAEGGFYDAENFGSATSIRIRATTVGGNLNTAAAGSVDVYVKTSTLP